MQPPHAKTSGVTASSSPTFWTTGAVGGRSSFRHTPTIYDACTSLRKFNAIQVVYSILSSINSVTSLANNMETPDDSLAVIREEGPTNRPGRRSATPPTIQDGARPQSPRGRAAVPMSLLQRSDSASIELSQQYEEECDGEIPDPLNYMVTMSDPKTQCKMAFTLTELANPQAKIKRSRYPVQSEEPESHSK